MKHLLGKHLVLDASFYYSYLDNAMIRAPYTFNGLGMMYEGEWSQILAVQNLNYATIWGYQFGVRTSSAKRFSGLYTGHIHSVWTVRGMHFVMQARSMPRRNLSTAKKWTATHTGRYNGEMSHDELSFSEAKNTHLRDQREWSNVFTTVHIESNDQLRIQQVLLRIGIEHHGCSIPTVFVGYCCPWGGLFIALEDRFNPLKSQSYFNCKLSRTPTDLGPVCC